MLSELTGWRGIEETPRPDIEKLLNRIEPVDAVASCDVGLGTAAALLSRGVPALYFDLGGVDCMVGRLGFEPRTR